ncbi:tyrosine-type recombinase/integrase [Tamlana fucoidanivorans]|uniref:tyrosine-type recombinase/integrase n=1 Tax=Allotamlana fucoidanivorans TaxID=2583814 RepID=UPI00293908F8|nr:tyrosine-type recombinase/integrase [Tamlana fucoidanivorans]
MTENNIVRGIDNNLWINTNREKTDESVKVPVLPKALDIIKKYSQDKILSKTGNLLLMSSNQKVNSYLKEIAKDCGIYKNLKFHVARHTFATTVMLSNGVPNRNSFKIIGTYKINNYPDLCTGGGE